MEDKKTIKEQVMEEMDLRLNGLNEGTIKQLQILNSIHDIPNIRSVLDAVKEISFEVTEKLVRKECEKEQVAKAGIAPKDIVDAFEKSVRADERNKCEGGVCISGYDTILCEKHEKEYREQGLFTRESKSDKKTIKERVLENPEVRPFIEDFTEIELERLNKTIDLTEQLTRKECDVEKTELILKIGEIAKQRDIWKQKAFEYEQARADERSKINKRKFN